MFCSIPFVNGTVNSKQCKWLSGIPTVLKLKLKENVRKLNILNNEFVSVNVTQILLCINALCNYYYFSTPRFSCRNKIFPTIVNITKTKILNKYLKL